MLGRIAFTVIICLQGLATHAAQIHVFSGYTGCNPQFQSPKHLQSVNVDKKHLSQIGIGLRGYILKNTTLEGSLAFPFSVKAAQALSQKIQCDTKTGIIDVNAKTYFASFRPLAFWSRLPIWLKAHIQSGPWILYHHANYKDSTIQGNNLLKKQGVYGYGVVIGGGFVVYTGFLPKLPFDVSFSYYIPINVTESMLYYAPARLRYNAIKSSFISIKIGFLW